MNHLEVWEEETREDRQLLAWRAWVSKTEKLMGIESLDNDIISGYSLDSAYDAFLKGISPQGYARGERA